jgi:alginate O-acetyltransferase complex protein AlgI
MSLISPIFLLFFFPVITFIFYTLPIGKRSGFLLSASLALYLFASPNSFPILILVCILASALVLPIVSKYAVKQTILIIAGLLGILIFFKYSFFLLENINFVWVALFGDLLSSQSASYHIWLPIGISFYIFQALSFVFDYRKSAKSFGSIRVSEVFLYISFFPQLVAGPIVRFSHFYSELKRPYYKNSDTIIGLKLIAIGLCKKIIIADYFAEYVDTIFSLHPSELTWWLAMLGPILFFFQIYFDFSGYSDMAIGIGRIFNIRFLKNFKFPYLSTSVTEFWRRWHISLSSWFKDYLYIPLGGNRVNKAQGFLNLLVVFVLCGFWHGASWLFLLWGVWHGLFLIIEKIIFSYNPITKPPKLLRWFYTMTVVIIGWTIFRSENFEQLFSFMHSILSLRGGLVFEHNLELNFDMKFAFYLVVASFVSVGGRCWVAKALRKFKINDTIFASETKCAVSKFLVNLTICWFGLFALANLMRGTFSSFIYFQF